MKFTNGNGHCNVEQPRVCYRITKGEEAVKQSQVFCPCYAIDQLAALTVHILRITVKIESFYFDGFFVVILKFWKLILLAIAGGRSAIWWFITGRKKKEEELATEPVINDNNDPATS